MNFTCGEFAATLAASLNAPDCNNCINLSIYNFSAPGKLHLEAILSAKSGLFNIDII